MKIRTQITIFIILGILQNAQADVFTNYLEAVQAQDSQPHKSGIYVGMSVGRSILKPQANADGVGVDDKSDIAYKFQVGYKFNKKLSLEGFYADMGGAKVHTVGKEGNIDYRLYGLSGIYTHQINRRLNGLIKLGYAQVKNTATNGITFRQIKKGTIWGGAGVEYIINSDLSIRGEYEYFNKDIQLFSVGANWNLF